MNEPTVGLVDRPQVFLWLTVAVGALLLIPFTAMLVSDEMDWGIFDFLVLGALLFVTGSLLVLALRLLRTTTSRVIAGGVVLALFAYVYVELAVGVFTDLGS